ncbi:hypothetical protein [Paraburkholderia youngii]|uniref:Uncharacterized protein n=1 Tax=Paraburkholderia youngii TaxID=2782701 RepID=A0ABX2NYT5_9BURK|nr:hypothetical protein [Paraburkholderia youngii]NVI09679.1 hypothetical protein [Paraburkholderia youngii]
MSVIATIADVRTFDWIGGNGSGCVSPLFKFIAGKRPVEFGIPEAASRQCELPIRSSRSI